MSPGEGAREGERGGGGEGGGEGEGEGERGRGGGREGGNGQDSEFKGHLIINCINYNEAACSNGLYNAELPSVYTL